MSLLLTFANFCDKILHLDFLELWLRVACPSIQMKFEVRCDRENTAGLLLIALPQFFVYLSYKQYNYVCFGNIDIFCVSRI